MKSTFKSDQQKEAIVAEYFLGGKSFRSLGKKHQVDFTTIHSWVMNFKGKKSFKAKASQSVANADSTDFPPLSTEVKVLQDELRMAKLHNELLNAIIDIAEVELKIDIRKKSGTKR